MRIGLDNSVYVLLFLSMLTGCATPEPVLRETDSGYAEWTYADTTPAGIGSKIEAYCVSKGLFIDSSTEHEITCSKEVDKGLKGDFTQLLLGNAYSTRPVHKIRFVLLTQSKHTRVIAYPWLETQMAGGQVRRVETNSSQNRNSLQRFLQSLGRE